MFYAQNRDVRKESVEIVQAPVEYDTEMHEFFRFLRASDMTQEENYAYACTVFDMDSVIDWMIIEGYSANGDVQQNLRYFRSTENGNKWQFALYDLDWAFYEHVPFANMFSEVFWQHKMMTRHINKNPQFREKFLTRLSELLATTLSTENVVKRIDELEAELDPEAYRDRGRWYYNYDGWKREIQRMRSFITDYPYIREIVYRMQGYFNMTNSEMEHYFGRWI
jgi:hypothetical protein